MVDKAQFKDSILDLSLDDMVYNHDQQIASDYIQELTNGQVGSGYDPVQFLIASHAALRHQLDQIKENDYEIKDLKKKQKIKFLKGLKEWYGSASIWVCDDCSNKPRTMRDEIDFIIDCVKDPKCDSL